MNLKASAGVLLLLLIVPSFGQHATAPLDLAAIGYTPLSAMARRSDKINLTLDFVDSDHLLVTFSPKKMFRRLAECPSSHDDRLIEAAIVEASTGKVLHRTTWYLHDGRPYLWPLRSQRFLLRRLNSFYIVDSGLNEKLAFTSPSDLLWVAVTPDGTQVLDEIAESSSSPKSEAAGPKIRLEVRDSETFVVQRVVRLEKEVPLEATSSGFASVIAGFSGKVWLVRFGPTQRQRESITRVRTHRVPDVLYLNNNTLLIGRDSTTTPGYSVSAFTVNGARLWGAHWDEHRYSPVVQRSEDGSRFAISTLRTVSAIDAARDAGSEAEAVIQGIQVFNTVTGERLFETEANPVFAIGKNFALSPNGDRLAVLSGTTIQFYNLRSMSSEERARYMALKSEPRVSNALSAARGPISEERAVNESRTTEDAAENTQVGQSREPNATSPASEAESETQTSSSSSMVRASSDAVPTFRSRRQIVALDVVVTDSAGHTVKGLPRDSFQVKEDGKVQAISSFSDVNLTSRPREADPAPVSVAPKKSPNMFASDSPADVDGGVTVILYDLLNTPASAQQNAKSALINFILHKPKNARFALCSLSEGLSMIQGFTPDEGVLARAVKNNKGSLRFTAMKGEDVNDQMLVNWLQAGAGKAQARLGANGAAAAGMLLDAAAKQEQDEVQRHSRDLEFRMAVTMDAFTQLSRYLAALPGRKSIIWLSGSFPLAIFPGMDFRNPYSDNPNNSGQIKQTVNLLAESHVAVYPVDVRGLTAAGIENSTFEPPQPAQFKQTTDTKRFDELSNLNAPGAIGSTGSGNDSSFAEEAIEHGLMKQIADDTGGKAFFNGNGLEQAMNNAMEQQANYYELSYTPTNTRYDGKFRRIKVTAGSDKRLYLIHRSGYFAVDPDTPVSGSRDASRGFGLAAMQAGAPQARQLVFSTRVAPLGKPALAPDPRPAAPVKRKKGHGTGATLPKLIEMQRYALDYEVSASQIDFQETADGLHHGEVNFMVASFAQDGSAQTSIGSRAKGDLSPTAYQDVLTSGLQMHQEVDVPVSASSLRVGVQDTTTGHMGTLEINLPVPALPGSELSHKRHLPEIEPD